MKISELETYKWYYLREQSVPVQIVNIEFFKGKYRIFYKHDDQFHPWWTDNPDSFSGEVKGEFV